MDSDTLFEQPKLVSVPMRPTNEPVQLSDTLRDALRGELRRLIDSDDFVRNLPQIQQVAATAHQLCLTLRVGDPNVMRGRPGGPYLVGGNYTAAQWANEMSEGYGGVSGPSVSNPEQFGASMVRQIVDAVPDAAQTIADALTNRPDHLVAALVAAESGNLPDVAASLRGRLMAAAKVAEPKVEPPAPAGPPPTTNGVHHAAQPEAS